MPTYFCDMVPFLSNVIVNEQRGLVRISEKPRAKEDAPLSISGKKYALAHRQGLPKAAQSLMMLSSSQTTSDNL
jgi:hypothetical protein